MIPIAKRMQEARLREKLSQEKLGVLAGLDEMSASARMNQYERGKHIPHFSTLERIAGVLGLPVAYFYSQEDDVARLLISYQKLTEEKKKRLIAFIDDLSLGD